METKNKSYSQITAPIQENLTKLDLCIDNYFSKTQHNPINTIIKNFLSNKGKRIRSVLIFLLIKALGNEPDEFCYNLALTQEFIHNATLIHDDIIDCSLTRRGKKTLNIEYDSKLAVLAGDYLLSEAIQLIDTFEEKPIRKLHSDTIRELINGELNQYFNRFKMLSITDYIEKSKAKTARLFECGIVSAYWHLTDVENKDIKDFAINFGTAFQIKNDLDNFLCSEKTSEDIKNGDYSAPVIYYAEKIGTETIDINKPLEESFKSEAVTKTQKLIKEFSNKAIENIAFLEDNLYKQALTDLCNLFS